MVQTYDGLGRLTSIERYNGASICSTQSYTYNWDNLVASNTTAAGNTYSYNYDQNGRITQVTNPGGSTVTTSYDDVNNIKTVTDENGHEMQYLYNSNDLVTSVREYYETAVYNRSYRGAAVHQIAGKPDDWSSSSFVIIASAPWAFAIA